MSIPIARPGRPARQKTASHVRPDLAVCACDSLRGHSGAASRRKPGESTGHAHPSIFPPFSVAFGAACPACFVASCCVVFLAAPGPVAPGYVGWVYDGAACPAVPLLRAVRPVRPCVFWFFGFVVLVGCPARPGLPALLTAGQRIAIGWFLVGRHWPGRGVCSLVLVAALPPGRKAFWLTLWRCANGCSPGGKRPLYSAPFSRAGQAAPYATSAGSLLAGCATLLDSPGIRRDAVCFGLGLGFPIPDLAAGALGYRPQAFPNFSLFSKTQNTPGAATRSGAARARVARHTCDSPLKLPWRSVGRLWIVDFGFSAMFSSVRSRFRHAAASGIADFGRALGRPALRPRFRARLRSQNRSRNGYSIFATRSWADPNVGRLPVARRVPRRAIRLAPVAAPASRAKLRRRSKAATAADSARHAADVTAGSRQSRRFAPQQSQTELARRVTRRAVRSVARRSLSGQPNRARFYVPGAECFSAFEFGVNVWGTASGCWRKYPNRLCRPTPILNPGARARESTNRTNLTSSTRTHDLGPVWLPTSATRELSRPPEAGKRPQPPPSPARHPRKPHPVVFQPLHCPDIALNPYPRRNPVQMIPTWCHSGLDAGSRGL